MEIIMKRIIGIAVLFVLALCFFYSGILEHVRDRHAENYYIPEKEWAGLETTNYSSLLDKEIMRVMMTGTSDPEPQLIAEEIALADASVISCAADRDRFSLQEKSDISLVLTHTNAEGEAVPIYKIPNLERWNGTEWVRLIYLDILPKSLDYECILMLPPGETETLPLRWDCSVTRLIAGRYRAVVYVGYEKQNAPYEKIYAEFELTE